MSAPHAVRPARTSIVLSMIVAGGLVLAACSSSPSSSTTSTTAPASGASGSAQLSAVSAALAKQSHAVFEATYSLSEGGNSQTVTIAQDSPKTYFSASGAEVISTGQANQVLYCSNSGNVVCVPESGGVDPIASLVNIFSANAVIAALHSAQAQAQANAAGVGLSYSTQSFAGQSATCVTVAGPTTGKYCVTNSGILAYVSAAGATFQLTSYTSSPPASIFSAPAGATIETVPSVSY
ncbi:MAG: hypothetical protein ACYDD4_08515 [Acidimicrobiales bacterium]